MDPAGSGLLFAASRRQVGGAAVGGAAGCWAFASLAGEFRFASQIKEEWLWKARDAVGAARGGRVPVDLQHTTVLVKLDDTGRHVLRRVVRSGRAFAVTVSEVRVEPNERYSKEFGEPVYSVFVALECPELADLRDKFVNELATVHGNEGKTRRLSGSSSSSSNRKSNSKSDDDDNNVTQDIAALRSKHVPYHQLDAGWAAHCTLAYIKGDCVEAARELVAEYAKEQAKTLHNQEAHVNEICLMHKDGTQKWLVLGGGIPLAKRAVNLRFLEEFIRKHQVRPDETTADVVSRLIVPLTTSSADSFSVALVRNTLDEGLNHGTVASKRRSSRNNNNNQSSTSSSTSTENKRKSRRMSTGSKSSTNSAGVDILKHPQVGTLDFFVSHAWRYPFHDLVDAIRKHSENHDPDKTKYWLDIFAVNQHQLAGSSELGQLWSVISKAKSTLLVVLPWDNPVALTRIWCLYEILGSMRKSRPLEVEIPTNELQSFRNMLTTDFTKIRTGMANIDSEHAEATNAEDRDRIRVLIRETVGFAALNTSVKDELRAWLVRAGLEQVNVLARANVLADGFDFASCESVASLPQERQNELLELAHQVALVLGDIGQFSSGRLLLERLLLRCESDNALVDRAVRVANDLAFMLTKSGENERAEEMLRKYLVVAERLLSESEAGHGRGHGDGVDSSSVTGESTSTDAAKSRLRFASSSLSAWLRGVGSSMVRSVAGGGARGKAAATATATATATSREKNKLRKMKTKTATKKSEAGKGKGEGLEGKNAMMSAHGSTGMTNLEMCLLIRNNLAMAVGAQSRPPREAKPNGGSTSKKGTKDDNEYAARFEEAKALFNQVLQARNALYGTAENPHSVATTNNLAWLLAQHGKQDEAEPLFERVYAFRSKVHGDRENSTLNAAQNLAQTLMKRRNFVRAKSLMVQVVDLKVENAGLSNPTTLRSVLVMVELLIASAKNAKSNGDDKACAADLEQARAYLERVQAVDPLPPRITLKVEQLKRDLMA